MMTTALAIWAATLAIIALVVVPLALALLHRALRASLAIEAYLADMLAAGQGIAHNTASVAALDETLATARAIAPVATAIADTVAATGRAVGTGTGAAA